MSISIIARIIYLVAMFVSGFIIGSMGGTFKDWRYWAMVGCLITVYCCGYIGGGCQ